MSKQTAATAKQGNAARVSKPAPSKASSSSITKASPVKPQSAASITALNIPKPQAKASQGPPLAAPRAPAAVPKVIPSKSAQVPTSEPKGGAHALLSTKSRRISMVDNMKNNGGVGKHLLPLAEAKALRDEQVASVGSEISTIFDKLDIFCEGKLNVHQLLAIHRDVQRCECPLQAAIAAMERVPEVTRETFLEALEHLTAACVRSTNFAYDFEFLDLDRDGFLDQAQAELLWITNDIFAAPKPELGAMNERSTLRSAVVPVLDPDMYYR